ncbi:MAG: long-chain fatty acid--CoA ligase [Chloroflexi bacterium]|nr:long-chain fatty acid--CoA ligase [Chloroflexota bacterium]
MTTYAQRPWVKNYDAGVPASLEPYPDKTLHEFLTETARVSPSRIALATPAHLPGLGWQTANMTYGELNRKSDALAAAFISMGLKKGDRVAIVLPNSAAFAIAYFAVLKAGGVVAATNPTYPAEKMRHQINDSDAPIAVTLSLFYSTLKQIQPGTKLKNIIVTNIKEYLPAAARLLFTLMREKKDGHRVEKLAEGDHWLQDMLRRFDGQKPNAQVTPEDIGLFQYTGGTTGVSKAAKLPHRALVANLLQMMAWTSEKTGALGDMNRSDLIYLGAIPMFHVYGLVVLLSQAVASGSKIIIVSNPRDVDNLVGVIKAYKPNVFLGVPAMFNAVVNHPDVKSGKVPLNSFLLAVSGAAPLPPATKREFESCGGRRLTEAYGMSETSAGSHSNPMVGDNRTGSVGMPLPDMDVRVVSLDDGVTDVPVGEIGEIVMAGPNIMVGYHGMPTETANALREHNGKKWLHSGDIGYMDADGYFYIVDRQKDMVLIGGFNVYPNNIEKVLKEHPAVLEVGVAGIPHPEKRGEEALKAWIVLKPGMTVTEQELIAHCAQHLAGYEVPRRYTFIPELPKTLVGKTLRRELIRMEMDEQEGASRS